MLNFVCLSKNCVAFRKFLLRNGVVSVCGRMPHFSTCSVLRNQELPKVSYLKDSNDGQLGPDDQYPDWLWNIKGTKQSLNELDPHGRSYSRILRKTQRRDENERRKMKRF